MVNLRPETTISGRRNALSTRRCRAWPATVGIVLALLVLPGAVLEIGHTSVRSKMGERLDATVKVIPAPGEHLEAGCLSLARDQDLAGSGHILITDAALSLQSGNGPIRMISATPVTQRAITLALRVQCSDGPAVVQPINLYLNPEMPLISRSARPGSTLTVKPGDSVYKLARLIDPHNEAAAHKLARAIALETPALFPDRHARPLQVGERLIIPDLRTVNQIIAAATVPPGTRRALSIQHQPGQVEQSKATTHDGKRPQGTSMQLADKTRAADTALNSGKLKLANELKPGHVRPQKQASTSVPRTPPTTTASASAAGSSVTLQLSMIASRIDQLRVHQSELDARLDRLEVDAAALQKVFASKEAMQRSRPPAVSQPAVSQTVPPTQRAVDNRRSSVPQSQWFIIGGLVIVLLLTGFVLARLFRKQRDMRHHRRRIDALLEEARTAATPLLDKEPRMPERDLEPAGITSKVDRKAGSEADGASDIAIYPDVAEEDDTHPVDEVEPVKNPWRGAEMTDSGLGQAYSEADEVPASLQFEMDTAMDSTRSMFSDVDRFITLGRIENAIGLLEIQIKRNPADRKAWVKLMAIYRDYSLNDNFGRTYAAFREQFDGKPGY